ncbi:hypothetical protein OAB63_02810 [Alphaproteobacteria bacterium]|nr:hypothetical protein [Alphaproteobacteria bacterium]
MKRILIILISLLWASSGVAGSYLFKDNLYTNCEIITDKDPTILQNLLFVEEKRTKGFDRRRDENVVFKAFIFRAVMKENEDIIVRVNAEFKSKDEARIQALKYSTMVGQLSNFLRSNLKTVTIHKGNKGWGGGNNDILIHTQNKYFEDNCNEEVMLHESGHVSLDWSWGGSLNSKLWKKAAKADGMYITKYAKRFSKREDVAETINWWIGVRCYPERIDPLSC